MKIYTNKISIFRKTWMAILVSFCSFLIVKYIQPKMCPLSHFYVCSSVVSHIFILVCNHYHCSSPKFFSSYKTETLHPLDNNSPLSLPSSLWSKPLYNELLYTWGLFPIVNFLHGTLFKY